MDYENLLKWAHEYEHIETESLPLSYLILLALVFIFFIIFLIILIRKYLPKSNIIIDNVDGNLTLININDTPK